MQEDGGALIPKGLFSNTKYRNLNNIVMFTQTQTHESTQPKNNFADFFSLDEFAVDQSNH